jgi:hypothetical protein
MMTKTVPATLALAWGFPGFVDDHAGLVTVTVSFFAQSVTM